MRVSVAGSIAYSLVHDAQLRLGDSGARMSAPERGELQGYGMPRCVEFTRNVFGVQLGACDLEVRIVAVAYLHLRIKLGATAEDCKFKGRYRIA